MEAGARRRRVPWLLVLVAFPCAGAVVLWIGAYVTFMSGSGFLYVTTLATSLAGPVVASAIVVRGRGYGALPTAALSAVTLAVVIGLGSVTLLALLYAGPNDSVCPDGDIYC